MPRKQKVPSTELVICHRLREFRQTTKIPRTVFASEAGIVGARLINCELGVTPLTYGLFKAINDRFFVNPEWLVTGTGGPDWSTPMVPSFARPPIDLREPLSAVWERRKDVWVWITVEMFVAATKRRTGAIWLYASKLRKLLESDAFEKLPPGKRDQMRTAAQKVLDSWEKIIAAHARLSASLEDINLPRL